ncbi:MAG: aspartate/glutamate racemase family protein [Colwellia sp.]|nr:aspartate/glutamate racemase family protein [Colwellia sp.]
MSNKKFLVIIPIGKQSAEKFLPKIKQEVETSLFSDFSVDYQPLYRRDTDSIQSRFDEFWDTNDIIKISLQAEKDGYAGIFVDCFGEPGVSVVRELVNIPVLGGFMASISSAILVANKFSIVTVVPSVIPMFNAMIQEMNIAPKVVSIRDVGIPVLDLLDEEKLKKAALVQSLLAIEEGAEAIILGCTGMLGISTWLAEQLKAKKDSYIPVISPTAAAITALQSLIISDLSQSRLTYFSPSDFDGTYPPKFNLT